MNYNEPDPSLRRIPIYLENSFGAPAPGEVITGAEIQVSLSGAAFVNGAGAVTEVSAGSYFYTATQAETVTDSFLMIKVIVVAARPYVYAVDIGLRIAQNEPLASKRRIPIYLEDSSGSPVTGLVLAGADRQVSENGAAYVDGTGLTVEIGAGAYYYELAASEINVGGFGTIKVDKAPATPYVYTWDVFVTVTSVITVTNLEPPNGQPILPDTPLQFEVLSPGGFAIITPWIILDPFRLPEPVHDTEDFTPLYQGSVRTSFGTNFRYTLRRRGGWTSSPRLLIWAVDTNGGIWIGP